MRENRAKRKLQNGEVVTVVSGHQNPDMIDYLGSLGLDGVWLEGEHGPLSWDEIGDMSRACDLWGMTSVTRVNSHDPGQIMRNFDRGSQGVIVPHVSTRDAAEGVVGIQKVLDAHALYGVHVNPESRVKVAVGAARPVLVEQGWRTFLVKVHKEAGVTAENHAESPNAKTPYRKLGGPEPPVVITPEDIRNRWLDLGMYNEQPLGKTLSGLPVEYRVIQIFSRDAGNREATVSFLASVWPLIASSALTIRLTSTCWRRLASPRTLGRPSARSVSSSMLW